MDLVVAHLRKDSSAPFSDIKAAAEKEGLTLFPITYGRAKALLGLVPTAKRGEGKIRAAKAAARAASETGGKRGPGRPRKVVAAGQATAQRPSRAVRGPGRPRKETSILGNLSSLVASMRQTEQSQQRMRATLEKVAELIGQTLRA